MSFFLNDKVLYKKRNLVCTVVDVIDNRGYIIESDTPNIDGELWKLFDCEESEIEKV